MRIKDAIDYIIDSFYDGKDWVVSHLTQKLGRDRLNALLKAIFLICLGVAAFSIYFGIQEWRAEQHAKQISDAKEHYNINRLDDIHFRAKENYLHRNYESALSSFIGFLNQFPSVLYTEDSLDSHLERSKKVDEAIIKVVLSLRKLNKNNELSYYVRFFKNKFPKSKLAVNFNSNQSSILDWYQSGVYSLYDTRRLLLEMEEFVAGLQSLSPMQKRRRTEELSESTRRSFDTAREVFGKLLSNEHLNQMPYSELRVEALYFIAKSLLVEGNYRRAYQEFDRITTAEFGNYPDLQDDAMYYAAYCLKERKVYDEAFGRYTEFMTRFPNSEYVTDVYFDLGEIYAFRKEYDNARDSYESALQRAKDQSHKVKLQLAETHANYKRAQDKAKEAQDEAKEAQDKAIRIYRELSTEYLEDSFLIEALDFISEFPKQSGDWNEDLEEKINAYERFVRKHGQNREAKFQAAIGYAYYDEGNDNSELGDDVNSRNFYNKAITAYKLLLDRYPESDYSPHTKVLIANIYNKLDEHSESIKAYERIIDEYEDDYGKGAVARIEVTTNVSTKETDPEVISKKWTDRRVLCVYEIGEAYFEMNDFEKALEWHRKITEENGFKSSGATDALDFRRDSLAPDVLYGAMKALVKLKRYEELEQVATVYIADRFKDAPLLSAEAQLNFAHIKRDELNQPDKAILEYKKLSEQFEIDENGAFSGYLPQPNLRFNLIRLYGKYYEGRCYEGTANQKDVNSELAMVKAYKEATRFFKITFQPLISASNINIRNRDHYITEATKIFKDLVNRHPKNEDAAYWQYLTGEYYFAKKDFENAIAEYEKVLKSYPTSTYIKDASDRIEKIRQELGNKIDWQMGYSDESGNSKSLRQTQTDRQLTPEEIAEKASDSTVFLHMPEQYTTGSGFFVSPGLIATNYHVIAGTTRGYAYLISKNLTYAIVGVVATDEERDLAILKVSAFDVPPLPHGNSDNIKVGETVYAAGSPKGVFDTISDGIISRLHHFRTIQLTNGQKIRARRIQFTASTSRGSSGGPVLNSKGEVIGINHGSHSHSDAHDINMAIPVNYLEKLLKRVGTPEPLNNFTITSR